MSLNTQSEAQSSLWPVTHEVRCLWPLVWRGWPLSRLAGPHGFALRTLAARCLGHGFSVFCLCCTSKKNLFVTIHLLLYPGSDRIPPNSTFVFFWMSCAKQKADVSTQVNASECEHICAALCGGEDKSILALQGTQHLTETCHSFHHVAATCSL